MSEIENPEEMYRRLRRSLGVIILLAFPLVVVGGIIPLVVWMFVIIPLRYNRLNTAKAKGLLYVGLYILATVVAIGVEGTPYEIHLFSHS